VVMLKEAHAGLSLVDVARRPEISSRSYYKWKAKTVV
jgi:hypothetical protein